MKKTSKSIYYLYSSTIVKMRITKCLDWHIEGEIIERNCHPEPVAEDYVFKMKKDLEDEKQLIKKNKQEKLLRIKAKKGETAQNAPTKLLGQK